MARLSSMPDKLRAAFLKKTYALAERLKSKVQQNLTNKLLNIRSGNLVRSIFQQVSNETNEVSGRVYSLACPTRASRSMAVRPRRTSLRLLRGKPWPSTWVASKCSLSA